MGVKPDLLLILVIFYGLIKGKNQGAIMGFVFGLVEDLLLGLFIGSNALSKSIIGFVIGSLEGKIYKDNLFTSAFAIISGTLLNGLFLLLIFNLTGAGMQIGSYMVSTVLPMMLYNLIIGIIVYFRFYRSVTSGILSPPHS